MPIWLWTRRTLWALAPPHIPCPPAHMQVIRHCHLPHWAIKNLVSYQLALKSIGLPIGNLGNVKLHQLLAPTFHGWGNVKLHQLLAPTFHGWGNVKLHQLLAPTFHGWGNVKLHQLLAPTFHGCILDFAICTAPTSLLKQIPGWPHLTLWNEDHRCLGTAVPHRVANHFGLFICLIMFDLSCFQYRNRNKHTWIVRIVDLTQFCGHFVIPLLSLCYPFGALDLGDVQALFIESYWI